MSLLNTKIDTIMEDSNCSTGNSKFSGHTITFSTTKILYSCIIVVVHKTNSCKVSQNIQ